MKKSSHHRRTSNSIQNSRSNKSTNDDSYHHQCQIIEKRKTAHKSNSIRKLINCPNPRCNHSYNSSSDLISYHMKKDPKCRPFIKYCKCGSSHHNNQSLHRHLRQFSTKDQDHGTIEQLSDLIGQSYTSTELSLIQDANSTKVLVNVELPPNKPLPDHAIGVSASNYNPHHYKSSANITYPAIDPIDKDSYFDYLDRIYDGHHNKDTELTDLNNNIDDSYSLSRNNAHDNSFHSRSNSINSPRILTNSTTDQHNRTMLTGTEGTSTDTRSENNTFSSQDSEENDEEIPINQTNSSNGGISVQSHNSTSTNSYMDDDVTLQNSLIQMHNEVSLYRIPQIFDKEFVGAIDLWQILHKSNAPIYLFDEIMNWAILHSGTIPKRCEPYTYKTLLKSASSRLYPTKYLKLLQPKLTNITLPSNRRAAVSSFDCKSQLYRLLSDPELMQWKNLIFSGDSGSPFETSQDIDPQCCYGEIDTGEWYRKTHNQKIINPSKELLVPIVKFIDATCRDAFGKISLEGIVMTLGIFKRHIRNRPNAWVTEGYIENLDNMHGSKSIKTADKLEDYHYMINHILKEYEAIQNSGLKWTFYTKDGKAHTRLLKFCIIFIIGDTKGNDALCGRYGSHTNTKGLCRDCDVPTDEADNVDYRCKFLKHTEILQMNGQQLKNISFRIIRNNIFSRLCFGANPHGINGAVPPEPLHCIKLGPSFSRLPVALKTRFGGKLWKRLDNVVASICSHGCRQSNRDFPSILNFRKGMGSGSKLTADEKFARCFAIFLALSCNTLKDKIVGQRPPKPKKKSKKNNNEDDSCSSSDDSSIGSDSTSASGFEFQDTITELEYEAWINIFEESLIFYHWVINEEHPRQNFVGGYNSRAANRCREYMKTYKNIASRSSGMGLKIVKFHHISHWWWYITQYGSMRNVDGGRPESNAIQITKNHARRTQGRADTINQQTCQRYYESSILKECIRYCPTIPNRLSDDTQSCILENGSENINNGSGNSSISTAVGGSRFVLTFVYPDSEGYDNYFPDGSICNFKLAWLPKRKEIAGSCISKTLLASVARKFAYYCGGDENNGRIKCINGFTELKYGGDLYRCHPSYRQSGMQWNDCAFFKWNGDIESNEGTVNLEGQIHMFLDFTNVLYEDRVPVLSQMHSRNMHIEKGYYCVIHSVDGRNEVQNQRKLIQRHTMEEEMHVINIDTIQGPAFLIHDSTKRYDDELFLPKEVISVVIPNEWSDIFLPSD